MNKHDFLVCSALDGLAYSADIKIQTGNGATSGIQRVTGSIDVLTVGDTPQTLRLREMVKNEERVAARILDQPFSLRLSRYKDSYCSPMERTLHLDFEAVVGADGPFTNR